MKKARLSDAMKKVKRYDIAEQTVETVNSEIAGLLAKTFKKAQQLSDSLPSKTLATTPSQMAAALAPKILELYNDDKTVDKVLSNEESVKAVLAMEKLGVIDGASKKVDRMMAGDKLEQIENLKAYINEMDVMIKSGNTALSVNFNGNEVRNIKAKMVE